MIAMAIFITVSCLWHVASGCGRSQRVVVFLAKKARVRSLNVPILTTPGAVPFHGDGSYYDRTTRMGVWTRMNSRPHKKQISGSLVAYQHGRIQRRNAARIVQGLVRKPCYNSWRTNTHFVIVWIGQPAATPCPFDLSLCQDGVDEIRQSRNSVPNFYLEVDDSAFFICVTPE